MVKKNKRIVYADDDEEEGGQVDDTQASAAVDEEQDQGKQKRKRKRNKSQSKDDSTVAPEEVNDSSDNNNKKTKKTPTIAASQPAFVPPSASALVNDRTVYMEGLPFTATEQEVRDFFKSVKSGALLSLRLPRWQDSGNLRGYGHAEFQNAAAATEALALDGAFLQKRFIKVERPMTPRLLQQQYEQQQNPAANKIERPAGCRTIFVKNLPYDTTEAEITDVFKVCGPVQNVRIPFWGHTNQQKGIAYIMFKREDSAEIAVKKSLQIRGRPLQIDYEVGEAKRSFKPAGSSSSGSGSGGGVK